MQVFVAAEVGQKSADDALNSPRHQVVVRQLPGVVEAADPVHGGPGLPRQRVQQTQEPAAREHSHTGNTELPI